ncbi:MAG: type IV pilus modification protein PilV [bacterium]|nr:type IV pilus modification protein PilV [bacterium]
MSVNIAAIKNHQGITLLEVLISVIILSVSMLGIAGILIISSKANNSSYAKQQAVQLVYNIFEKMRTNSSAAINGDYNISNIGSNGLPTSVATPSVLCNSSVCTPTQLANYDTWQWLTSDVSRLPNGSASISTALSGVAGNTIVTITVQWDDSPAQTLIGSSGATATSNGNFVQLTIQSQL